jgi:hypothetical protein
MTLRDKIIKYLEDHPESTVVEVQDAMVAKGTAKGTVWSLFRALVDNGEIKRQGKGWVAS